MKEKDMDSRKNIDNSSLDGFFGEHFNSMPPYEGSENRDKILLNTIMAEAEAKRRAIHSSDKSTILDKLAELFSPKLLLSPKFAVPMAAVMIVGIYFIAFYKNPATQPYGSESKKPPVLQQDISKGRSSELVQPGKENSPSIIDNTISVSDLGRISYDYTVRGAETEEQAPDELAHAAESVITDVLSENGIAFTKNANTIETEWLSENGKEVRLLIKVNESKKEVRLSLESKAQSKDRKLRWVDTKSLKKQIEDNLYKYISLSK
jgi:hypothetical protein